MLARTLASRAEKKDKEKEQARIGGGERKKQLTPNLETITSQAGKNDSATSCLSAV